MLIGRRKGGMAAIACPSSSNSPLVGNSKPAISRRSVVLPQPEGPSSVKNSFCRIERLAFDTAFTAFSPLP